MLAIQAAGRFDDDWEGRVHTAVPIVASMLRPLSQTMVVAAEILDEDTTAIFGTYQGKQLEESSQRLIVSFVADNSQDGSVETVRTHRIDESAGHAMYLRLIGLQPGDRCLFFKTMDKVTPKMSVRILAGFERLPPRNAHAATPPQRSRGTGAERPARVPPSRAEAPVANPNKGAVIRGLLEKLSTEDELKAKALLVKYGWEGVDDISDDDWSKAMYIARHAKDDWF
jgi:hypothetical protein